MSGWKRLPDGRLQHTSGLIAMHDDDLGWETDDDSLQAFQETEAAKGATLGEVQAKVMHLLHEAAQWLDG